MNASARAGKIALSLGMDVKVASMQEGVDPADLISKNGVDAWRSAIRESKHIIEFFLEKVLNEYKNDTRKAGRAIKERVLPYVNALESRIEKADFLRKISDASQIRGEDLREDLSKIEKESKTEKDEIEQAKSSRSAFFRKDYILNRLLGIVFWQKSLNNQSFDVESLLRELTVILGKDESTIFNKAESNKEDLIFEAEVFYGDGADLKKDTMELLRNLKEEDLKEKLSKKIRELKELEEKKEVSLAEQTLKEINEINKQIEDIKSGR